jgi:predicted lipoprotein with Yx(FWY)xxD motif
MQRLALVALLVASVGIAACGGDDSSVRSARPKRSVQPTTTTTTAPKPTVQVAQSPLGTILVDANGLTLYQFDNDTATAVACTGQCATTWPPLTVKGTPVAGAGVDANLLATIDNGTAEQVTYAGHPLYLFSGDQAAGQTNGFGSGGVWWVLAADGTKITPPPPPDTQPRVAPAQTSPPTEAPPPPPPPPPPATMLPGYGY